MEREEKGREVGGRREREMCEYTCITFLSFLTAPT